MNSYHIISPEELHAEGSWYSAYILRDRYLLGEITLKELEAAREDRTSDAGEKVKSFLKKYDHSGASLDYAIKCAIGMIRYNSFPPKPRMELRFDRMGEK